MQYEMITSEIAFWNAKIDSLLKVPCETNEAKLNNLTLQEYCSKHIEKLQKELKDAETIFNDAEK